MIAQFENDLHDWHIDGVMFGDSSLSLHLRLYEERKVIKLTGVTRCLMNDFLIQNIIFEAKIISAADHPDLFQAQVQRLDETYPRRWVEPMGMHILHIGASVGAEIIVEFADLEISDAG
jgi:hypothetical protein